MKLTISTISKTLTSESLFISPRVCAGKHVPPLQSSSHTHCPDAVQSQLDETQLFSQSSMHSKPSGQPVWKQPAGLGSLQYAKSQLPSLQKQPAQFTE